MYLTGGLLRKDDMGGCKIPTEGVQMHPLLFFRKPCPVPLQGLFIKGLTPCAIAKELTRRGILTVTGRAKWNAATINGVLANEKYTGCARIQKTFTPDFLTKKVVKNTGQVPRRPSSQPSTSW